MIQSSVHTKYQDYEHWIECTLLPSVPGPTSLQYTSIPKKSQAITHSNCVNEDEPGKARNLQMTNVVTRFGTSASNRVVNHPSVINRHCLFSIATQSASWTTVFPTRYATPSFHSIARSINDLGPPAATTMKSWCTISER